MKEIIIKVVSEVYGIDGNELFGTTKHRNITDIKQAVFYFLRTVMDFKFQRIAKIFHLGHSNVIAGTKAFEGKINTYSADRIAYNEFKKVFDGYKVLDKELLSEFLKENDKYLSAELKNYLSVKL